MKQSGEVKPNVKKVNL